MTQPPMPDLPYEVAPVPRLRAPGRAAFMAYVAAHEPVVVEGATRQWKLYAELAACRGPAEQLTLLERRIGGGVKARYQAVAGSRFRFAYDDSFRLNAAPIERGSFASFVTRMRQVLERRVEETLYLQAQAFPTLIGELEPLAILAGLCPRSVPLFWIGSGNQVVGLHNDPWENCLGVLTGKKRVLTIAPGALADIYPGPFNKPIHNLFTTQVDFTNPDFERFPRVRRALEAAKVAVVSDGDLLYLPPLWWHNVEGFGFNVGFNCWMEDVKNPRARFLYFLPAYRLLEALHRVPRLEREPYRDAFHAALGGDASRGPSDAVSDRVVAIAHETKAILDASATPRSRDAWTSWVLALADVYVFRIAPESFPTLSSADFESLAQEAPRFRFLGAPAELALEGVLGVASRLARKIGLGPPHSRENGLVPVDAVD